MDCTRKCFRLSIVGPGWSEVLTPSGRRQLRNDYGPLARSAVGRSYAQEASSLQPQSQLLHPADTTIVLRQPGPEENTTVVIGVHHGLESFIQQVKQTVEALEPEIVAVEACSERMKALGGETPMWSAPKRTVDRLIRRAQDGSPLRLGDEVFIMWQQSWQLLFRLVGIRAGREMLVAAQAAEEVGARVLLADRSYFETVARMVDSTPLPDLLLMQLKLFPSTDEEREERIQASQSGLRAMARHAQHQVARKLPGISRAMIEERDQIMFEALWAARAPTVVAVVGMGHLDGIERLWNERLAEVGGN